MPNPSEAEENLRVIRSLMEKATVYRAISAPGALIGGLLSLLIATVGAGPAANPHPDGTPFVGPWLLALFVTGTANAFLLWRDATRRGDAFVSPGMKLVLRAMTPGIAAGGLCLFINADGGVAVTASLWVLCYGVSLLGAANFAPGSIRRLGWLFFIAGSALVAGSNLAFDDWHGANQVLVAHLIMGATFGLFHLIYAVCAWPRKALRTDAHGQ